MKHAIIGTVLILYGLFLTPCYIEPSDVIISTALISSAVAASIPLPIISIWIISGYLALLVGAALLGHSIFTRIPAIASSVRNPIALVFLVAFIVLVVCMWAVYVS